MYCVITAVLLLGEPARPPGGRCGHDAGTHSRDHLRSGSRRCSAPPTRSASRPPTSRRLPNDSAYAVSQSMPVDVREPQVVLRRRHREGHQGHVDDHHGVSEADDIEDQPRLKSPAAPEIGPAAQVALRSIMIIPLATPNGLQTPWYGGPRRWNVTCWPGRSIQRCRSRQSRPTSPSGNGVRAGHGHQRVLATALGVGIPIDTTIVRALLVPALLSVLGRWNWWLP